MTTVVVPRRVSVSSERLQRMIDLKNKVVFVHVPKCAGTSVENYFMNIRGLDDRNRAALGIFKNDKAAELERGNQHCTLSMIETLWFGGHIPDDFRIFTIVRNPYSRFWSEYSYRYLPPPDRYPISTRLPLGLLIYLARHPIARLKDLNSHLRPQWTYLQGAAQKRMRVLRFENVAEEFPALVREWGLPDIGLPHANSSGRKSRIPTEAQLNTGNAFVEEFYSEDFSRLGYDAKRPRPELLPRRPDHQPIRIEQPHLCERAHGILTRALRR